MKLQRPNKEDQIDAILSRDVFGWYIGLLRDSGWEGELGDPDDPTRCIGFDCIISVSPEDVYNVAKKRGMDKYCQHYLSRGEGTSIYENGKNTFIHSTTERGDELIQGVFDTLQAAEMSVIESRYNDAKRMLNSRKTKSS